MRPYVSVRQVHKGVTARGRRVGSWRAFFCWSHSSSTRYTGLSAAITHVGTMPLRLDDRDGDGEETLLQLPARP
jgi:hypothetical protein